MKIESFLKVSSHLGMLASTAPEANVHALSTGILGLDLASGIGGFPRGRIVEVLGLESSGKTTVTLHAMAAAHERGEYTVFIDAEHAYDGLYAASLGVDPDMTLFHQPDSLNDAISAIHEYVKIDEVGLIILDSIAMAPTEQQINGNIGDANIASKARLLSQELPQIIPKLSTSGKTLICLNGLREKPGLAYGNPFYSPGGYALKFAASMRIELSKKDPTASEENPTSSLVVAKFRKNKVAVPFTLTSFNIIYGHGADNSQAIYDYGIAYGIITKKGNTHLYRYLTKGSTEEKEDIIGKSQAEVIKYFQSTENEKRTAVIEQRIRTLFKEQGAPAGIKVKTTRDKQSKSKPSEQEEDEGLS